jgi:predicted dehydrogenase
VTVRVALVGCGTVARVNHLPGLRAGGDADIVVFASRSLESARHARDAWGSGDITTAWATAVARDDVDAVHVCVPNALHAEVAAVALSADKHVLVEKPMTTTLADADALLAIATDRLLAVAFDARCNPLLTELRRLLPSLGALREIDVVLGHAGPEKWAPQATWFRDAAEAGGGCLIDLGSHVFDALAWCAGPLGEVVGCVLDGPVEEQAELDLLYAGGVSAHAVVSWRLSQPVFTFSATGEHGALRIADGRLLRDGTRIDVPPPALPNAAAAFARSIATCSPAVPDGAAGRAALADVLAAYTSAASGQRVRVA